MALVAGVSAGCSTDVSRFTDTIMTGSTKNQQSIVNGQKRSPTYDEIVTGSANSAPKTPSTSGLNSSVAVYDPPSEVVASGKSGWTTVGGTRLTVREGDTVASMSRRYGVPQSAIMNANPNISKDGHLQAGQQVVIPTYVHGSDTPAVASVPSAHRDEAGVDRITTGSVSPAPAAVSSQPFPERPATNSTAVAPYPIANPRRGSAPVSRTAAASGGGYYTVQSGDTISSIASRHGVRSADVVSANGLANGNAIRVGQKLTIPAAGAGGQVAAAPAPVASPSQTQASVARAPAQKPVATTAYAPDGVDNVTTGSVKPVNGDQADDVASTSAPQATPNGRSFRWPVRGRVISEFGPKANGQHNDGINLAVPAGTSVKAAEEGVVIYSGNELKGYGSLILVRHSDGWVTAYAHNSELLANRGDSVRRGQVIAKAGASGSVSQPQVHFELRKGSRPVDPMPYLAGT